MTTGRDEPEAWGQYRGKANSHSMLRDKARIISQLLDTAIDTGVFIAQEIKNKIPSAEMGHAESLETMAETAAVLLRVVDETAFHSLPDPKRHILMTTLEELVGENLQERGFLRDKFSSLLEPRYAEYAHYKKWVASDGESAKGTLFWEYAKKVAFITGIGKNALFNVMLSNLLIKQLKRWNLVDLIRG